MSKLNDILLTVIRVLWIILLLVAIFGAYQIVEVVKTVKSEIPDLIQELPNQIIENSEIDPSNLNNEDIKKFLEENSK
jgi:uncharacterized membrane protein YcaP (DUF421 family)|tara:strand:- start:2279 stop:2512 length:234 start_codon:yes stop_codon:yes gene_type:complete